MVVRAPQLKAFLCPESLWENWECTVSWPALAWGCCVLVPRAGVRHSVSMVAWLFLPVDSGKCSFPATWAQLGSGHQLPTTKLGWRAAPGTALGEHAILAPDGAMGLEVIVAPVWMMGLQRAWSCRCLGKGCLSLIPRGITAWQGDHGCHMAGLWDGTTQHGKARHGDVKLRGCTPIRTIGSPW